jgi:hypothetical protein
MTMLSVRQHHDTNAIEFLIVVSWRRSHIDKQEMPPNHILAAY